MTQPNLHSLLADGIKSERLTAMALPQLHGTPYAKGTRKKANPELVRRLLRVKQRRLVLNRFRSSENIISSNHDRILCNFKDTSKNTYTKGNEWECYIQTNIQKY